MEDLISISTSSIIFPMLAMCSAPSRPLVEMDKTRSERLVNDPEMHVLPLPSVSKDEVFGSVISEIVVVMPYDAVRPSGDGITSTTCMLFQVALRRY